VNDSGKILMTLLEASGDLSTFFGSAWPKLEQRLADLILRLDIEGESGSLRNAIDSFVNSLRSSSIPGREFLDEILGVKERSQADGGPLGVDDHSPASSTTLRGPESQIRGSVEIPVYYATDRQEQPGARLEKRFTETRGTLAFGVCRVSIPLSHRIGSIELPKWWHLEFYADKSRHVILLDIRAMTRAHYQAQLRKAIASADSRDVLVFVHGYNVKFADAVRRTAQIAFDLKFRGRTLLYSWPSKGGLSGYFADEATVEWSTPHFEQFLRFVMTEVGAHTVHLLAHSMGGRITSRAIEHLDASTLPEGAATLRQIIFAAPDIDRDVFLQIAEAFHGRAERFTLYASNRDVALRVSKVLHKGPRAGDSGDTMVLSRGIDTVDASEANTSLFGLGHSYCADTRSVLDDMFDVLTNGTAPEYRFNLLERTSSGGKYWWYRP
jgi:esterase/lipase superfamily enzyme